MAKKKSEVRRHSAVARITPETLEQAKLAASLMKLPLAEYVDDVVKKAADRDVDREVSKLAKKKGEPKT